MDEVYRTHVLDIPLHPGAVAGSAVEAFEVGADAFADVGDHAAGEGEEVGAAVLEIEGGNLRAFGEDGCVEARGAQGLDALAQVDEVLSFATITPAVIQNENHLYYQNTELREYVKQYGIVIESWYPFGGRGHTSENFNNETIVAIAQAHNKTSAQIILRWQLQAGYIAIPGSSNPDHILENITIFDFELTEDEMRQIAGINQNQRYENW